MVSNCPKEEESSWCCHKYMKSWLSSQDWALVDTFSPSSNSEQSEELSEPCFCASWVLTNRLTPPNPLWFLFEWCFPGATPERSRAHRTTSARLKATLDTMRHIVAPRKAQRNTTEHNASQADTSLHCRGLQQGRNSPVSKLEKLAFNESVQWNLVRNTLRSDFRVSTAVQWFSHDNFQQFFSSHVWLPSRVAHTSWPALFRFHIFLWVNQCHKPPKTGIIPPIKMVMVWGMVYEFMTLFYPTWFPKKLKFWLAGSESLHFSSGWCSTWNAWAVRLCGPDALPESHQRRCAPWTHGKGQAAYHGAKTAGFLERPRVSWRGCTRKMDAFEMGLKFLWIWNNMFNTCERKVSGTIGTIPIDKTFKCTPTESEDQLDYAKWTPSGSLRSRTRPWSMESMESIDWSDTVCNRGQRKPHPNDKTLDASLCVRWDPHQEQFGCYPNQTLLALSLCLEFFVWQSRFCCSQSMIDPHVHHFMISWSASGVGTRLVPGLPFFRPRRKEEEQQLQ
jgi:hypothetical protein